MSDNAFHEKAGRSQVGSFVFFIGQGFSPAELATDAILPSALWWAILVRSVQVGRSRFSRCCHLLVDLYSSRKMQLGQALDAVTGTRLWARAFPFL